MASYALVENDLIEIVIKGRLHGQTTRNVFHYRYTPAGPTPDGAAELAVALDEFVDLVVTSLIAFASVEWHCISATIQKVKPTRYQVIEQVVNLDGTAGVNSLPSGASAVVSIRAILADRNSQGRKFFPAIPVEFEEDSILNEDGMTSLGAIAGNMLSSLNTNDPDALVPTTLTPTSGVAISAVYDVLGATPREVIRYQRRREVGVGE